MLIFAANFFDISPETYSTIYPNGIVSNYLYYSKDSFINPNNAQPDYVMSNFYSESNAPAGRVGCYSYSDYQRHFWCDDYGNIVGASEYDTIPPNIESKRLMYNVDIVKNYDIGRSAVVPRSRGLRFMNLRPSRRFILGFHFGFPPYSKMLGNIPLGTPASGSYNPIIRPDYFNTNSSYFNYNLTFIVFVGNNIGVRSDFAFIISYKAIGVVSITPVCRGASSSRFNSYEAYIDNFCLNHIEFLLDSTGSHNYEGRVACRVNGYTIFDIDDVSTTFFEKYNSNPNDPVSKYNSFAILQPNWCANSPTASGLIYTHCFSDIVLCNEEMGFMDSFIGPIEISTLYPDRVGNYDSWSVSGASDTIHAVSKPEYNNSSTTSYIETESAFTPVTFKFVHNLDSRFHTLYSVFTKAVFSHTPSLTSPTVSLTPIFELSGYPLSIERSKEYNIDDFVPHQAVFFYPVTPILAVPWTLDYFSNCDFGLTIQDVLSYMYADDSIAMSDQPDED